MAKKLGPGKCVHCLKDVDARNSDHVFPESWYPDSTPPGVEKWQIPSCIRCNSDYGKLEQDFFVKVGLCLDPFDPAWAYRRRRPLVPTHGDHLFRSMTTRGRRCVGAPLDASADLSVRGSRQA